jgi:hypothetical protein
MSKTKFIEYIPGDLPLIISVPHDGDETPFQIQNRTCRNAETKRDLHTIELAEAIRAAFITKTGSAPHLIICHLRRRKLDVNRSIEDGACDNPLAMEAWQEYHDFIDSAAAKVTAVSSRGLYVDLHAHGHTDQFLELGYLLDPEELRLSDDDLNDSFFPDKTSIRHLYYSNKSKGDFCSMIRGEKSLGTLFESKGYPAIPSEGHPSPAESQPFFRGGYSINFHGSTLGGSIDGIQIETNQKNVRDSQSSINKFADAFYDVMRDYLVNYYDFRIPKK